LKIQLLTTTFYKEQNARFHLATQTIGNAVAMGYGVTVLDGSPNPEIGNSLKRLAPQISVYRQSVAGMGASRRELFKLASGADYYLWTEPEKTDIVRLIPEIMAPFNKGLCAVVIPRRTSRSLKSYPVFQVGSEMAANDEYAMSTGLRCDIMFGPVAFVSSVKSYFEQVNPAKWGAADNYIQHYAPLLIHSKGKNVDTVNVDFFYPSVQLAEEESELRDEMLKKRQVQFDELTKGYALAAKALCLIKQ
jgi:hypothetical protein